MAAPSTKIPPSHVPVLDQTGYFSNPYRKWAEQLTALANEFGVVPQNLISSAYTLTIGDQGASIDRAAGLGTVTVTIPENVFQVGAEVNFDNGTSTNGVMTIAAGTGVTLVWAAGGGTGSRSLAAAGIATIRQIATNVFKIWGTGLS